MGVEILALIGVLPKLRGYFDQRRRRDRATLLSQIADDVISVVAIQKGISQEAAASSHEAIAIMRDRVIAEGVKASQARAIAERSLAGRVVKQPA
jgi:hypothetical protein